MKVRPSVPWRATEPDAGSDVLSVTTRADKEEGGYRVNGSKMFISNGNIADFFVTLCLTQPEAESRHELHTVLIIDADSPGITRNKIRGKLGIRAHDTAEIAFSDVKVPALNRVEKKVKGFGVSWPFLIGPEPMWRLKGWALPRPVWKWR